MEPSPRTASTDDRERTASAERAAPSVEDPSLPAAAALAAPAADAAPGEPANDFKYWAFLSYSHQDNLAERTSGARECVRWAEWLHRALETYRVPSAFRGRLTPTGDPMPARFFPVFQDEKELPLDADLAGAIAEALEQSRFLIVICSPRSAASFYVNEEVRRFKQMGRQDRILALIVAGEPNASDGNHAAYTAADECFCPALRHPVAAAGAIDMSRRDAREPIAGDVRVKDGPVAREARRADLRGHREALDFIRLKLLAGMMGVGFDELVQRDKARQATELRRRIAVLAVVALAIAALAVYALIERGRAVRGEQRIAANASRSHYDLARMLLTRGDDRAALAHLAESLRTNPNNQVATSFALNLLLHREWPIPERATLPQGTRVRSAGLSPDGRRLLTWAGGTTLVLWDTASGSQATPPIENGGEVVDAFFSRDSTRVLTTSANGMARVWEVATGRELQSVEVPGRHQAEWFPDEKRLLTLAQGEYARVWNPATGLPLTARLAHPNLTFANASPDGTRVLTASADGIVQVWDAAAGTRVGNPLRHGQILFAASFSSDGTRIVTAASDGVTRVWDAATGTPLAQLRHDNPLWFARTSPAGERIVTRTTDGRAHLWNAVASRRWAGPIDPGGTGFEATLSSDGARLLVPAGGRLTIWNVRSGSAMAEPVVRHMLLTSASPSADGQRVVSSGWDGSVRIWDAATGKALEAPMKHDVTAASAVFSADGTRVVSAAWDGTVQVWHAYSGAAAAPAVALEGAANCAAFSPDGRLVAAGGSSGQVRIFDAVTGTTVHDVSSGSAAVHAVAFSPDGGRLVTAGGDSLARVWDVTSGQELLANIRHGSSLSTAVFSPDGLRILTASSDRTARIWDAATGAPLIDEVHLSDWANGARFSPDGARFVTAARDGTVQVWDSANGDPLAAVGPLSGRLALGLDALSAEFSPDGRSVFVVLPMGVRRVDLAGYAVATEDLARLVESLGGRRFDGDSGRLVAVPDGQLEDLRARFPAHGEGEVARLGHWFFADRATRPISPWNRMTFPEWTARRLAEEGADGPIAPLEELLTVNPRDPALLLTLAHKLREREPARAGHYVDLVRLFDPGFPVPAELEAVRELHRNPQWRAP